MAVSLRIRLGALRLGSSAALGLVLALGSTAALAQPAYTPVYETDFPDPFILPHANEFIGYSTNSRGINLPMARSRDLIAWSRVDDPETRKPRDGMPLLAPWVKEGSTWAPEVLKLGGRWLLYYTAKHGKKDYQCVGVAVATDPRGPFRDASAQPLVCQDKLGGTIDANPFRDRDGKLYLYYKNDGNRIAKPTEMWGQELARDGLSLVGSPISLIRNDRPWEAHVIEAASMVRVPGGYAMFFSAYHYGWETHQRLSPYAVGYAICSGPLGPCKDAPGNPILYSYRDKDAGCLSGPGHQSIFSGQGGTFIAFHAWAATKGCRKAADERYLYVAPFGWEDGKPVIAKSLRPVGK